MVSKVARRSPPKPSSSSRSLLNHQHHHKKKKKTTPSSSLSPLRKKKQQILASIQTSIRSCRRRLLRVFSRLTTLGDPTGTPSRRPRDGFRLLKSLRDATAVAPTPAPLPLLPPVSPPGRRTVFLDLDETLVHSKTDPPPPWFDFVVRPTIDGQAITFYVLKRPGVDDLLAEAARSSFEIVVFTAGLREYASLVLDRLDPTGTVIRHRLYRDSCTEVEGGRFVKDLEAVGRDLGSVVIVDDNPNAYMRQPENALPVSPFVDDLRDKEMERLAGFFQVAEKFEDTRDAVSFFVAEGDRPGEMSSGAGAGADGTAPTTATAGVNDGLTLMAPLLPPLKQ